MKIICEKDELMKSINIVSKAVPVRTTFFTQKSRTWIVLEPGSTLPSNTKYTGMLWKKHTFKCKKNVKIVSKSGITIQGK